MTCIEVERSFDTSQLCELKLITVGMSNYKSGTEDKSVDITVVLYCTQRFWVLVSPKRLVVHKTCQQGSSKPLI